MVKLLSCSIKLDERELIFEPTYIDYRFTVRSDSACAVNWEVVMAKIHVIGPIAMNNNGSSPYVIFLTYSTLH